MDAGRPDTEVRVVGAGPVGLTLALALTRLPARVRVIDRDSGTKRQQRAAVVRPRASEVLRDLGVAGASRRAPARHLARCVIEQAEGQP